MANYMVVEKTVEELVKDAEEAYREAKKYLELARQAPPEAREWLLRQASEKLWLAAENLEKAAVLKNRNLLEKARQRLDEIEKEYEQLAKVLAYKIGKKRISYEHIVPPSNRMPMFKFIVDAKGAEEAWRIKRELQSVHSNCFYEGICQLADIESAFKDFEKYRYIITERLLR